MMGYVPKTQNDRFLSDVISAVQKEVRRGNEEGVLYWCFELIPDYERYLWQRLVLITNEDIGIANPLLLTVIPSLREQFFEFRSDGKNGNARIVLANAVLLMCRSPKSRIGDNFQAVVATRWMIERREVPGYALDNHTVSGRALGRSDKSFWLDEGCRLENKADVEDPYEEEARRLWAARAEQAPEWKRRHPRGYVVGIGDHRSRLLLDDDRQEHGDDHDVAFVEIDSEKTLNLI